MASDHTTQVLFEEGQQPVLLVKAARVAVAAGPDAGRSCSLELRRVRIGYDPDNDLALTDPRVSRHHLELHVRDSGYRVLDLRSKNGTRYRGARIREAFVEPGAELRVGGTLLKIEAAGEARREVAPRTSFGALIGSSAPMQALYGLLATVAPSDVTVLIEGETGVGKELVAEELHRHSPRKDRPFCVVDCGALSANLVESELFGHVRGAFTGAVGDRKGVFERADGGTVFLDEVGELPLELQTRLLRVLDRRTVKRVGSETEQRVDVRLVAATNRSLPDEVKASRFRSDLYYRLAVVPLKVPPLRERKSDILLLARHFLWEAGNVDPEAVLTAEACERLERRRWSGNVRELRNALQRATVMAEAGLSDGAMVDAGLIDADSLDLPPVGDDGPAAEAEPASRSAEVDAHLPHAWLTAALPECVLQQPYKQAKEQVFDAFDAVYLGKLQQRHEGNISRMARDAGVDRQVIRRLLHKHQEE